MNSAAGAPALSSRTSILILDRDVVRNLLTFVACIPLMREAMTALSNGETLSIPRGILDMDKGRALGIMMGCTTVPQIFGAKLVSVFPDNHKLGLRGHQGVVALFEAATGGLIAIIDAGEITRIRTAAASAAATDVLARPDSTRLTVLGHGEQARAHVQAIFAVRDLTEITLWSQDVESARVFAKEAHAQTGLPVRVAMTVEDAVHAADIICTTTAASEPILKGEWVMPGCHLNVVGSSRAGPAEIDHEMVTRSRFFADDKDAVLLNGAEFLKAKEAGLVDDSHVLCSIGQVFDGSFSGRTSPSDITIYKSLGSIFQDLSAASYVYHSAMKKGLGTQVQF